MTLWIHGFSLDIFYVGILGVHVLYISFGIKPSDLLELLYNHHGLNRAPVYSKCIRAWNSKKSSSFFSKDGYMDENG